MLTTARIGAHGLPPHSRCRLAPTAQAGLVVKSGATLGKVGMNLAFAGISLGYYATAKK